MRRDRARDGLRPQSAFLGVFRLRSSSPAVNIGGMATGTDLRDRLGFGRYVVDELLARAPTFEPIPFRGRTGGSPETLPFFDELEQHLGTRRRAIWNVLGPSGTGKTLLGRWAAARWGKRFLESPETNPLPLFVELKTLYDVSLEFRKLDPTDVSRPVAE